MRNPREHSNISCKTHSLAHPPTIQPKIYMYIFSFSFTLFFQTPMDPIGQDMFQVEASLDSIGKNDK